MEAIYDWLFHYNPYTEVWAAFKKNDKDRYMNGQLSKDDMYQSKKITVLLEFMYKDLK
jgi:hypothetical protein